MATAADLTPKISIIVPVYNVEKYLRRCLDSIVAQTFTDWECILIDDGSPDNSGAICDEYAERDSRFHVIHQENKGVSAARNAGLDVARGEWIGFVDSDDWIEKETFYVAYNEAINANADIVCFGVQFVAEEGLSRKVSFKNKEIYSNFKRFPVYMNSVWNKLFRKNLFHTVSLRFQNGISICEDMLFSFQACISTQKIVYLNQIFYNYFENFNSCTKTKLTNKKIEDTYKVYEYISALSLKLAKTKALSNFIRYENAVSVIVYLSHPEFFSPKKFREKSLSWNIWVHTFRPDLFVITLAAFLHVDWIPSLYVFLKKIFGRGI